MSANHAAAGSAGSTGSAGPGGQEELAADLERALARHELAVLYQPIVDLATLRMVGAEALLRWLHPTRGLLPPAEFIPAAEESGQIVPIGAWTLAEACRRAQSWRGRDRATATLGIAVNVSGRQLRHPGFVTQVRAALESCGLDPRALLLELTETVLLEYEVVGATLERVKDLGVGLAVDDFGTGHASLEYLARFPLDALKVDMSYVGLLEPGPAGEGAPPRAAGLVRGIVLLGHSLGLRTIAEGISSAEQLRLLRAFGCQLGQGRLFDGPLDATALESRLGARLDPLTDPVTGPVTDPSGGTPR
jgi:EAL domain-containing protein (putative c-di-GMP-specific phosphodiesterase class I)